MPAYPHIEKYHADLARLQEFAASADEQGIRRAFAACLSSYCRGHAAKLELVEELRHSPDVIPDGTVKDAMRLPRGHWEAKTLRDDLDAEIRHGLDRGYPNGNILFENSRQAVLIQGGTQVMQADMQSPSSLHRIIQRFLNYETPEVKTFHHDWLQFKNDLPKVLDSLRQEVASAAANENYKVAAARFLALCHRTISPQVTEFDVQEMLIQHTLTKDLFLRVFGEDRFYQENNIARQLDDMERSFFTAETRRETIGRLLPYYTAITTAAVAVADYREKQRFLKAVYKDFYQAYNPTAADRLGAVYTPDAVVEFIIRGTDHLLEKHFGRRLKDDNVEILDPATGTGTFITGLINYLPADRLERKYLREIHASEVAILPYYIANLNIEYSYKERSGRSLKYPNLCFVDTLDNLEWRDAAQPVATHQTAPDNLGAISEENWLRIQEQNEKNINVIIGNPPYNDSQNNWNDSNPNRPYLGVDARIRETYVAKSSAQKTHQYDMYKRFIRWASDRLAGDGVIAFITNRSYIDSRQDDGFRKVVLDEFSDLYIVDLGGDIRKGRPAGNIFGIMTGVAVGFFVRKATDNANAKIHYHTLTDAQSGADKLAELTQLDFAGIPFRDITPDDNGNWLNQSNSHFAGLMPIASKQAKSAKFPEDEKAVFALFANGSKSNRDAWIYDFDADNLRGKTWFFANVYNGLLDRGEMKDAPTIKWSRDLHNKFHLGKRIVYNDDNLIQSLFRPFVVKHHFADFTMNDVLTRNHYEIFGPDLQQPNKVICFSGIASAQPFQALATDRMFDFGLLEKTQCLPMYRYLPDGRRVNNITDWAVQKINDFCRKDMGPDYHKWAGENGFSAEDVFAYVYAVLHDPDYRFTYATDLRREFPRLPLYCDFDQWVKVGRELMDLHLGFETAEPWPLERIEKPGPPGKPLLRADKANGAIILDAKTTLTGIPKDAWRYRLGRRSALEWVLNQHKERTPKDSTIRERFNVYRFADHKERVIDLLRRLCTVGVNTMDVVDDMAYWDEEVERLVVFGDRDQSEFAMLSMRQWLQEPEDPEWEAAWSEI